MQNGTGRLRIHTEQRPEIETPPEETNIPEKDVQAVESTRMKKTRRKGRNAAGRRRERGEQLTHAERLVRNAALSCALFLSVMAVRNIDQPWSRQATEGIRQAMTMSVDWDETLGELSFVRALVPDTALVFLNLGSGARLSRPVQGDVTHEYTEQQPWMEYRCEGVQPVCAVMAGTVTAVGQGASGDYSVLVNDGEGNEAVYGYLASVCVEEGGKLEAGQQIGTTADENPSRLYFEWKEGGTPVNPAARMR